jgi:hypothetical protein
MPYGTRVFMPGPGPSAEGDKEFIYRVYNDTSNDLTNGMPVYDDVTDAAEFNGNLAATAISPAIPNTGGNCVLGTNANAGPVIGVYQPENPNELPAKGATIRILVRGRGVVSAVAAAAGTAVLVGDYLIANSTYTSAESGHVTAVLGKTIGVALATGTAVASGNSIIAVPGSGTTVGLVNATITLR